VPLHCALCLIGGVQLRARPIRHANVGGNDGVGGKRFGKEAAEVDGMQRLRRACWMAQRMGAKQGGSTG